MNAIKFLVGVLGMSLILGTGVFAGIAGSEPGTPTTPKNNKPKAIQQSTPSGEDFPIGSGPEERSDPLIGLKEEKTLKKGHAELEKHIGKTPGGEGAITAEDLQQKGKKKPHTGISAQSSKHSSKKNPE